MTAAAPWDYQSLPGGSEYDIRLDSTLTSGQIIEWEIDGSTVTFQPHELLWSNSLDPEGPVLRLFITSGQTVGIARFQAWNHGDAPENQDLGTFKFQGWQF